MFLNQLQIINFRNHKDADFSFEHPINCFTGSNGCGKTNILDAIHYLSFSKSFINSLDSQNIHNDEDFFVIQGKYSFNESEDSSLIHCGQKRNQKKSFKWNKKEYERLSDHVGKIPLVLIAPSDIALIYDGSEERRRFLDSVISQFDKSYLNALIGYNRLLSQRNAWLKQAASKSQNDWSLIAVIDAQMGELAKEIYEKRAAFIQSFTVLFNDFYALISQHSEPAQLTYKSQLEEKDFESLCEERRRKDLAFEYTTAGVHKDDLEFRLNEQPLKKFASQGQQKSFIIALKLAQFDFIAKLCGKKPLLLLDDIFEKLDQQRITQLITLVNEKHFGQIFITDTHTNRISGILDSIGAKYTIFELDNISKAKTVDEIQQQA
jgi:DNA replication and repair protein RecF